MKDNLITRLSVNSVRYFRITLIAFVLILLFGYTSYTKLLPREGFPQLDFPTLIIQIPYAAGDALTVNNMVTKPTETVLADLDNIESITSQTSNNFAFFTISYTSGTDLEIAEDSLSEAFDNNLELPIGATPQIIPIKTNAIDGEHVILYALTKENAQRQELESFGNFFAEEVESLSEIQKAEVIKQVDTVYNPITQTFIEAPVSFNRYGVKDNSGEINIQNSILVGINPVPESTATNVSEAIINKINNLEEIEALGGFEVVSIYDEAIDLGSQIRSLESNALTALIAVAIVLFLFVSWRASIVATLFIPIVMCASFMTMLLVGVSINVISLFALILVLGLLVDDMIVIVESIDYHKRKGFKGIESVRAALKKVGKADVLGTITTILVFLPMLFIIGFLGEIIKDVPATVIITLSWSLIIAVTIMPLFSNILIPDGDGKTKNRYISVFTDSFGKLVNYLGDKIALFIDNYLSKNIYIAIVVAISFILIVLGGTFASGLKFSNFPEQRDSNGINILINFPSDASIDEQEEIAKEIEKVVIEESGDHIEKIKYVFVGRNIVGTQTAEILVELVDLNSRSITSPTIAENINEKIRDISENQGVDIAVSSRQLGGPPEQEYQSQIQLYGNDFELLQSTAIEISEYISTLEPINGVEIIDTKISYLDQFAKRDGRRFLSIESKLSEGADDLVVQSIAEKVQNEFDEETLVQKGLTRDALDNSRGFEDELTESVVSAGIALLGSFVIIYIFLVVTFNSFGRALLIMMAIPFSFFGLFAGLVITSNPISFFVIIGMIALVGIVVNNTIMLQDFAIQARNEGKSIKDSIVEAAKLRFRPLLSTSVTTIVGLIPLAISEPLWESLSVAIIFGLISSTTLVIFVFPAYYYIVETLRYKKTQVVLKIKNR